MKIGLRGGHSANCKGANRYKDEYSCMQGLYKEVAKVLEQYGHTVINCNSNASNANAELSEGARKANSNNVDLFISLHMNAGGGKGTEAWICNGSRAKDIAARLVKNYNSLGFVNRGVKYSSSYYEMRNVKAPNIIFETLFCDSKSDTELWSATPWDKLARAVANAIDPNIPLEEVKFEPNYYALEECNVVDGDNNVTGALWKDEQFQLLWVTDDYRKYVRYYNADKTKLKEGYIASGSVCKIGEKPQEESNTIYRVQVGAYKDKSNAEKLAQELKAKGFDAFVK